MSAPPALDVPTALPDAPPRHRPIRIALDAHTIGRRASGNETYVRGLMGGLASQPGVAITMLLDRDVPPPAGLEGMDVATLRFGHPFPRLAADLSRAGRRWGADLLHVQYVRPPTSDVPIVNTIHDISFEHFPRLFRPTTLARLRALVPWSGRRSAAVITVSEFSRRDILDRYGLDPASVFVTPEAAEPHFRPVPAPDAARVLRSLGLPDRFILSVGDLQPRKNLPRLLAAYDLLLQRGVDVPDLVLVGKRAWLERETIGAVTRRRLQERVRFTGFVPGEALPSLYSSAAVFVYPSLFEGFGLPILEALACGAPTVTSNVSSMPEVAGDAALLVDPMSVEEMAEAIERVLGDTDLRAELVSRGHARAREFSWDRTAAKTVEAYEYAFSMGREGRVAIVTHRGAPDRRQDVPPPLVVLTRIWPTAERPSLGTFVRDRVKHLGDVRVVRPRRRLLPGILTYGALLVDALRVRGPIRGVEAHVLFPTGLIGLIVARLRGVPLVIYLHGGDVRRWEASPALLRWMTGLVARRANRLVANSDDTAAGVGRMGFRATVAPPGVDLGRFGPSPRPAERLVLYLGGRNPRKGFAVARELADTLAGPFLREVDPAEVPDLLARHDVLLVPSVAEPFGLVAVEAIASGRWVIAAAVGGLPEIITDGVNGTLVEDGNFAHALSTMPDYDPHEVARTAERFSLERWQAALAAIWDEVAPPAPAVAHA